MRGVPWQACIVCAVFFFGVSTPASSQEQQGTAQPSGPLPDQVPTELAPVVPGHALITYENRELTIKARGASLRDVLRAVCDRIGADLDAGSVADEVVFGVAGPGPVKEVLTLMLSGSPYDLAAASSSEDQGQLARVVVFLKTKEPETREAKNPAKPKAENADTSLAEAPPSGQMQSPSVSDDETAERPTVQQMLSLISQAKSETSQADDGREMAKVLDEIEAHVKSGSASQGQEGSTQPTASQIIPGIAGHRRGHRR